MNAVHLVGYLKNSVSPTIRLMEVATPGYNDDGIGTIEVKLKYWAGGEKNYLNSLKEKSHVEVTGHLDIDKKFGTIIIVEQIIAFAN